jgi:hypothetical protein
MFVFMGMMVNQSSSWQSSLQQVLQSTFHALEHYTLHVVCSVVMATNFAYNPSTSQQQQQLNYSTAVASQQRPFSSLIMAAALATVTSYDSRMAGLLAGILGILVVTAIALSLHFFQHSSNHDQSTHGRWCGMHRGRGHYTRGGRFTTFYGNAALVHSMDGCNASICSTAAAPSIAFINFI